MTILERELLRPERLHNQDWRELLQSLPDNMLPCRPSKWERNKNIFIAWIEGKKLKEVGDIYGISFVRVHQLNEATMRRLLSWSVIKMKQSIEPSD